MNLLFRFIYNLMISFFCPVISIDGKDQVSLRVLPTDMDLNMHMNNGRFLSLMDIGRTRLIIRTGLYRFIWKEKWGAVAGGVNITFLKSLGFFQKYTLTSKMAGHYDNWIYIEQRFESKGKLVACALAKVTFLKDSKKVPVNEILEKMNATELGENEVYLEHLFNSEKEFLNHIKNDYN